MTSLSEDCCWWEEFADEYEQLEGNNMPNPFKVGDVVKCIKDSGSGYPGKVGEILVVVELADDQHIRFSPGGLGCQCSRFELYTQATTAVDALTPNKSPVDSWFDEHLADPKPKKERVPDELDWEKHKAFMRSLR